MARDPNALGRHFSELLDFEVTNYAFPGVGNVDICVQIKQAIADKMDFVVIGKTDTGRMLLKYTDQQNKYINLAALRAGKDQTFYSDTIPTFIESNKYNLTAEQRNAVKQYFLHIYDHDLQREIDSWMFGYWTNQLTANSIKYKILGHDFCVYTNTLSSGVDQWTFHTTFEVQQQAADILNKEIHNENTNIR